MEFVRMFKSRVVFFCGDGNGVFKDGWEVLIIVVREIKLGFFSKNVVGFVKLKIF